MREREGEKDRKIELGVSGCGIAFMPLLYSTSEGFRLRGIFWN